MLILAPKATDRGRFEARKMYPQYRIPNEKNIFIFPGIKPRHP
jgi:hypothetical protein